MKQIIFMMIFISTIINADLTRDTNKIVTDNVTKLMWQDDVFSSSYEWLNAISYCENLTLGTFSDWKLPNKTELLSIVDYNKSSPSISTFINTKLGYYWSSTTSIDDKIEAWIINFKLGHTNKNNKNKSLYVRCVR